MINNQILLLAGGFIFCVIIYWSFLKKERIYQYPLISVGVFLVYLAPKTYNIITNPNIVANITPEMVSRFLFMVCLSYASLWFVYRMPISHTRKIQTPKKKQANDNYLKYNAPTLFKIAIFYVYFGLFNFILSIPLSDTNELSGAGRTGITTILFFFGQLCYVGFSMLFLIVDYIKKERELSLMEKLAFILPVIFTLIVFLSSFKRSYLVSLALSYFIAQFFRSGYVLSRKFIIASGLVLLLIFNAAFVGTIRRASNIRGDWTRFHEADFSSIVNSVAETSIEDTLTETFESEKADEVKNAILYMDSVYKYDSYTLGLGMWQTTIDKIIPGQLLGREFKRFLMFTEIGRSSFEQFNQFCSSVFREMYNYNCRAGVVLTGFSSAFAEFSYFGFIFFAVYALIFKLLWYESTVENNIISQALYIPWILESVGVVTHSAISLIPNFIYLFFLVYLPLTSLKSKNKLAEEKFILAQENEQNIDIIPHS